MKLPELSQTQKVAALIAVLVLLAGVGVGKWVLDRGAQEGVDTPPVSQSPSEPPVTAGRPPEGSSSSSGTATTPPPSTSSASSSASAADQAKSAKSALTSLIPKWASTDYSEVGTDERKWANGWKDEPAASSGFLSQSKREFVGLFHGVISLEADAKVDSLKKIEKIWQEEGQSGWRVQVERQLTSSGGLDETETLTWEFTVDQKSDGTSEVTAFITEPSSGDH